MNIQQEISVLQKKIDDCKDSKEIFSIFIDLLFRCFSEIEKLEEEINILSNIKL